MNKKILTIATASLLVAGSGTAFAASGNSGTNDEGAGQKAEASVSKDQAAQIAKDKFGGQVVEIEKDRENGKPTYDVDMKETEKGNLEVVINAATGDIGKVEKEDDDKEEKDGEENDEEDEDEMVDPSTVNTNKADAKKAALQQVDGKVIKMELEKEDGNAVYEISINTKESAYYDVTVNAENGKVVKTEKEDAEDDDKDEDDDEDDDKEENEKED